MRFSRNTTIAPVSRSAAIDGRLASSSSACSRGRRGDPCLSKITEGRDAWLTVSIVPKSVSAETNRDPARRPFGRSSRRGGAQVRPSDMTRRYLVRLCGRDFVAAHVPASGGRCHDPVNRFTPRIDAGRARTSRKKPSAFGETKRRRSASGTIFSEASRFLEGCARPARVGACAATTRSTGSHR